MVDGWKSELLATYKIGVFRAPRILHQLGKAVMWREAAQAAPRRAQKTPSAEAQALARTVVGEAQLEVARLTTNPLARELVEAALGELP